MKSPHLDPDWLKQKYLIEGLSTYDIAALVGRNPKAVYQKLIDFGIPTRPRGQNLKAGEGTDSYTLKPGNTPSFKGKRHSEATRKLMSEKASRPRPYLRGKRNGMSGRTGATNPNYKGGCSPERQRLYSNAEIKAFIRSVLVRDNFLCVRCGSPRRKKCGLHVHHLKSWTKFPALRF